MKSARQALRIALATAAFLAIAFLLHEPAEAQGGVKYCKDFQTGHIIVVERGYPCPFPYAAIN